MSNKQTNENLIHIRLLFANIKIKQINLCEYSKSKSPIVLPKANAIKNITCDKCVQRWKFERIGADSD